VIVAKREGIQSFLVEGIEICLANGCFSEPEERGESKRSIKKEKIEDIGLPN